MAKRDAMLEEFSSRFELDQPPSRDNVMIVPSSIITILMLILMALLMVIFFLVRELMTKA